MPREAVFGGYREESREVEIPPSGGVAVNGCRMFHWMWIVPEPVETIYTGDTISNDMCDYDVTGEWIRCAAVWMPAGTGCCSP